MNNDHRIQILKLLYGYLLLLIFGVLICIIGLGKVEEKTSFGMGQLIGGLLVLAGGFAQWCFAPTKGKSVSAKTDSN